jgi:hypothetical protein
MCADTRIDGFWGKDGLNGDEERRVTQRAERRSTEDTEVSASKRNGLGASSG